ncbi:MAG: hypothetical protein IKH13_08830, partial [Clostridia bacterium]|nr:hypothetical protein [Clostridia bacterium]
ALFPETANQCSVFRELFPAEVFDRIVNIFNLCFQHFNRRIVRFFFTSIGNALVQMGDWQDWPL